MYMPKIENFWNIQDQHIIETLEGMRNQGLLELEIDGRYRPVTSSIDMGHLYLFTHADQAKDNCLFCWDVLLSRFGLIPTHCAINCWKVVIKARNVFELFQVFSLMDEHFIYGKAGVDLREFTGNFYNAFCYASGAREGQALWTKVVRMIVDKIGGHFADDFMDTIILKRGCTEMEAKCQSNAWRPTEAQQAYEDRIEAFLSSVDRTISQPQKIVEAKLRRWCMKAHMIGDHSYKQLEPITGPLNLGVQSVTYHRKEWLDG